MSIDITLTCDLCGTKAKADVSIAKKSSDAGDYFKGDLPRDWVVLSASHVSTMLVAGGMSRGPKKLKLVFCSHQHKGEWESCDHMARAHAGEVYRDKLRALVLEHKGAVVGLAEIDTTPEEDLPF